MDHFFSASSFSASASNNVFAMGSGSGTTKLSAYLWQTEEDTRPFLAADDPIFFDQAPSLSSSPE
jgi:hypothetical protein